MIHALVPWRDLTSAGVPSLKVIRRPLEIGEVIVPVGETVDPSDAERVHFSFSAIFPDPKNSAFPRFLRAVFTTPFWHLLCRI